MVLIRKFHHGDTEYTEYTERRMKGTRASQNVAQLSFHLWIFDRNESQVKLSIPSQES